MPAAAVHSPTATGAVTPDPGANAVSAAVDRLRFYVDRDREYLAGRRRSNETFRQARLRLGYELNRARRDLTRTSFGVVLRRLGLNRHTAHHAMRLAAEFSRPDGSLDLDKIADARDRGAGVLRTSIAGQRILAADPARLSCEDLRSIMRAWRKPATRTNTVPMVEGAPTMRSEGERVADQTGGDGPRVTQHNAGAVPASGPAGEIPTPTAGRSHYQSSPEGSGGGGRLPSLPAAAPPRAPAAPVRGGASGSQMALPFDEVVEGLTHRLRQVAGRGMLCPLDGDPRMAELRGVLARADEIALSLLRGGAGENPAPPACG